MILREIWWGHLQLRRIGAEGASPARCRAEAEQVCGRATGRHRVWGGDPHHRCESITGLQTVNCQRSTSVTLVPSELLEFNRYPAEELAPLLQPFPEVVRIGTRDLHSQVGEDAIEHLPQERYFRR